MTKFGTPDATAGPGSASKKVGLVGAGEPSGLRRFSLILSSFFLTSRWGSALGTSPSAFGLAFCLSPEPPWSPPLPDAFGIWSGVFVTSPGCWPWPPPVGLLGLGLGLGAGEPGEVGFGTGIGVVTLGVGGGAGSWT